MSEDNNQSGNLPESQPAPEVPINFGHDELNYKGPITGGEAQGGEAE